MSVTSDSASTSPPTKPMRLPGLAKMWWTGVPFAVSVGLVTALGWMVVAPVPVLPLGLITGILAGTTVGVPVGLAGQLLRKHAVRRFLQEHDAHVCLRCAYPLSCLPESGDCPECGTPYHHARIAKIWWNRYRVGMSTGETATHEARQLTAPLRPAADLAATAPADWSELGLREALHRFELCARRHGLTSPRFARFAAGLEQASLHLKRPLPPDLHAFYAWVDPLAWDAVFRNESAAAIPQDSWAISQEQPTLTLLDPAHITALDSAEDGSRSAALPEADAERLGSPKGWSAAASLVFARAGADRRIAYWLGDQRFVPGAVVALHTGREPQLLATSIAAWLGRVAYCDGIDVVLDPERASQMTAEQRKACERGAVGA